MCRWLAYSGPSIYIDSLVLKPENSLIAQSLYALESASTTNGDGFGIGWYDSKPEPGRFREILPAWNDENLRSISGQIKSGLIFAHVRASTGSATARANCHPFQFGKWLFMHNGKIGGFEAVRRDLSMLIAPEFYPCLQGSTDSEVFFYILLSMGLEDDAEEAFRRAVGVVLDTMRRSRVDDTLTMTAAVSDGSVIHALRFASDGQAPSLYYGCGAEVFAADGATAVEAANTILILSEPLDQAHDKWVAVPQSHILMASDGGIALSDFEAVG